MEAELSNLWHISRTALAGQYTDDGRTHKGSSRYYRMLWTSGEYAKAHPETSSTAAYKRLDRMVRS